MAKIEDIIGEANFQVVEAQIATILQSEFAGQNTLRGDSLYPTTIYYGQYGAVNEGSSPYVCVNWMGDKTSLESREEIQGASSFFIDVKAADRSTTAQILNAIRQILRSNYYYNLDLTAGAISRLNIDSVGIDFEAQTRGADGTASGGVNLSVDINEDVDLLEGVTISELYNELSIGDKTINFTKTI